VAACTNGSEAPPPDDPPGPLEALSEAVEDAWRRESEATTPDALRDAWIDQLDYCAASPEGRWSGVTYQPGPNRKQDWGDVEALDALAGVALLAFAGEHDRMPLSLQQRIADASPRGNPGHDRGRRPLPVRRDTGLTVAR
jgi:hypothetical protein